jgi:Rps23 Pro-64 3,4-dihydroxylase Tpa1-like proline 4-hydroxylase
VFRNFLGQEDRLALLQWVASNETRFEESRLAGGVLNPEKRVSKVLRDLGPLRGLLESKVREISDQTFSLLGVRPFPVDMVELELAAHLDGAHFAPHSDIPIGPGRKPLGGDGSGQFERLISCVYYFYNEPKHFSGGELRLHRFGSTDEADMIDIEPSQNSLVAFPSWVTHEVRQVRCPPNTFRSARYAVNCWVCKRRPEAP